MATAALGMIAQGVLGVYTREREGYLNQQHWAGIHLAIGYATLAAVAVGAHVTITDAGGKSFTLRTNQVGNFYTAEPRRFPLQVSGDGTPMPAPVDYGGCNRCHGEGGGGGDAAIPATVR